MSFIEWQNSFDDIFEDYADKWKLIAVYREHINGNNELTKYRTMMREGYARFHCSKCSNGWASAKAKLILYYPNRDQQLGTVGLRCFGQKCKKCVRSKNYFAEPEFDVDWIDLTLEKLHERISCAFYGKQQKPKPKKEYNKLNNIKGPHESALCEACQLGCCDQ